MFNKNLELTQNHRAMIFWGCKIVRLIALSAHIVLLKNLDMRAKVNRGFFYLGQIHFECYKPAGQFMKSESVQILSQFSKTKLPTLFYTFTKTVIYILTKSFWQKV